MLSKNILYCTAHAIGERNGHGTQFEIYPSHSGQLQCCPPTIIPLSHAQLFFAVFFLQWQILQATGKAIKPFRK
jgi:hypothetical protein